MTVISIAYSGKWSRRRERQRRIRRWWRTRWGLRRLRSSGRGRRRGRWSWRETLITVLECIFLIFEEFFCFD